MADVTNILTHDDELNDDHLMKYLDGSLSDEERHALEKEMADNAFVNDAVEGLETFANKGNINEYVEQLNAQLQKNIAAKKKRKEKRKLKDNSWILIAVVLIILLCTIGYYVLHLRGIN